MKTHTHTPTRNLQEENNNKKLPGIQFKNFFSKFEKYRCLAGDSIKLQLISYLIDQYLLQVTKKNLIFKIC